jgi:PKD repeat protein
MAQRYEKLVQEDLNVGVERVWVQAPGRGRLKSTQVGIHTVARGQQAYEDDWTPGSIAAGGRASTTVTVPDAVAGDFVMASHSKILTNDLRVSANVSAANTAQVVIHNPTSAAITVPAGTVRVIVFPAPGVSGGPVSPVASFTWTKGVEDQVIYFTDTSFTAGTISSWAWDFGFSNPTDQNPSDTFDLSGDPDANHQFTVTLVVTDEYGSDEASDTFNVNFNDSASGSGS